MLSEMPPNLFKVICLEYVLKFQSAQLLNQTLFLHNLRAIEDCLVQCCHVGCTIYCQDQGFANSALAH